MKNQIKLYALILLFANLPHSINARSGDQHNTILMIVGDDNGTVAPGHGTGDIFIRNRIEKVLGHKVILFIDTDSLIILKKIVGSANMVIVSESAHSSNLRDKLKSVTIPVLNYEAFIQDEMGMTAKEPSGDPGEPEDFAYGVRDKDTGIDILMSDHPLAAGLKGYITIYKEPKQITWGKVANEAKVIATLKGKKDAAAIYLYDKGARLFDGTIAAGMRIGFFLEEENLTGTSNFMTEDGLRLFDAAVKFGMESNKD